MLQRSSAKLNRRWDHCRVAQSNIALLGRSLAHLNWRWHNLLTQFASAEAWSRSNLASNLWRRRDDHRRRQSKLRIRTRISLGSRDRGWNDLRGVGTRQPERSQIALSCGCRWNYRSLERGCTLNLVTVNLRRRRHGGRRHRRKPGRRFQAFGRRRTGNRFEG